VNDVNLDNRSRIGGSAGYWSLVIDRLSKPMKWKLSLTALAPPSIPTKTEQYRDADQISPQAAYGGASPAVLLNGYELSRRITASSLPARKAHRLQLVVGRQLAANRLKST
jgi:hypothetical protein